MKSSKLITHLTQKRDQKPPGPTTFGTLFLIFSELKIRLTYTSPDDKAQRMRKVS
ncbi:MAG: hypothetical protein V4471_06390 [Pseudomonadota bacterium]